MDNSGTNTPANFDIIVFHTQCPDGISALWAADFYKEIPVKVACRAGVEPNLEDYTNKSICFVDICPTFEYLIKISKDVKYILILDHHKTTIDMHNKLNKLEIPYNIQFILDFDRAGCQITWDYFFPEKSQRPWFIDYVADRDLWAWKLESSKAINTALYDNDFFDSNDLTKLTSLVAFNAGEINKLIDLGNIVLKLNKKELDYCSYKAMEAEFIVENKTYNVWLGTCSSNLRSDLGNILANKKNLNGELLDFAAIWRYEPKYDEWVISLRGHTDSPDLSMICGHFGGGGHAKASGFVIKNKPLLEIFKIKQK